MPVSYTTHTSTAANTWSTQVLLRNRFNVTVWPASSSSFNATVTVQRKFGSTGTWKFVADFSTAVSVAGIEPEDEVYYRIGIATGNYTSGIAHMRISQ